MNISEFHDHSIKEKEAFWKKQAENIFWFEFPKTILDYSSPPFVRWFPDGKINLCYNAVDIHLKNRADQPALIYVSTETNSRKKFSFKELYKEVQNMSKIMISLGIKKGDRVLIYMPMIPEGVFAMLACTRIGAIHSVVFGGFASDPLAIRIEDATPDLILTADAGLRAGKIIPYKNLVDKACQKSKHKPKNILLIDRNLTNYSTDPQIDVNYKIKKQSLSTDDLPCESLLGSDPSYILYTSGTTGVPKGIQRDTGGYAVALKSSMKNIFDCKPGEVFFCASDIGWVVGHSYLVYAPLLNGNTTILFEGLPTMPDPGIWWSIVEDYGVSTMFTSPTAIRVLKKESERFLTKYKTNTLRKFFLAGEPLDKPTADWVATNLKTTEIIDNYWQTETGWPIISAQQPIQKIKLKRGSPSFAVFGYDIELLNEDLTLNNKPETKGILSIRAPLPPGCLQTIWGNDKRFIETYFTKIKGEFFYSTFDYAKFDQDGFFFILGRTDDVINVSGHRLGTREIEEAIQQHNDVAEVAVVGVFDNLKGQLPCAFIVLKDNNKIKFQEMNNGKIESIKNLVNDKLGSFARPDKIYFVKNLPKTRSGKLLRRAMRALVEKKEVGDLTTLEDPNSLEEIKKIITDF